MNAATTIADSAVHRLAGFLDAPTCAAVRKEMRSPWLEEPGCVLDQHNDSQPIVDEAVRKVTEVTVSAATQAFVRACIDGVAPRIGERFGIASPRTRFDPKFVLYRPGDYIVFHRDKDDSANDPPFVQERRISIVIFLNDASADPAPATFGGGALRFLAHDLHPVAENERRVLTLTPKEGLLVAFDPRVKHEVRAVTRGERFTIVTWLY